MQKVDKLNRRELLSKRTNCKKSSKRVPLVLTYSALLPDVHNIVHKHMRVLYQSERMNQVFSQPPLVAYRRDTNLCDTLVHAKTRKLVDKQCTECESGCKYCSIMCRDPVKDTSGGESYSVPANVNCQTRNVIYAISCTRCSMLVYVGETGRQLKDRMGEHLADVRLRRDKPISHHFDTTHTDRDLMFSALEVVRNDSFVERRIRENIWITKLDTLRPNGCNVKDTSTPAQLWRL